MKLFSFLFVGFAAFVAAQGETSTTVTVTVTTTTTIPSHVATHTDTETVTQTTRTGAKVTKTRTATVTNTITPTTVKPTPSGYTPISYDGNFPTPTTTVTDTATVTTRGTSTITVQTTKTVKTTLTTHGTITVTKTATATAHAPTVTHHAACQPNNYVDTFENKTITGYGDFRGDIKAQVTTHSPSACCEYAWNYPQGQGSIIVGFSFNASTLQCYLMNSDYEEGDSCLPGFVSFNFYNNASSPAPVYVGNGPCGAGEYIPPGQ